MTFARLEEAAHFLCQHSSAPPAGSPPLQEPGLVADGVRAATPSEAAPAMTLLSTKLASPVVPSLLVDRERLLIRLDEAGSHRLTLLSASAGWGKTTLLSTWASRCPFPLAWLSLDELDNEPTRFWVSVLSALRTCLPGVGEIALSMLCSPQPPPFSTCLSTLLNELGGQLTPTFLLLDDYHLISEQAIHDSVLFLLEHLPVSLHLVLASRVDPPLSLARLRARGQLLELRDVDLRFEQEETVRFLTHTMHLSLSQAEIAELARRTEGWIAGLQLAALSLLHHPNRAAFVHGFTGSHRYVLDYVQEELLERLPASMRAFVLQTAILTRLSASLCQAVTTQADAGMLEALERANLFLVPLDDERRWYRFHDLFREALLSRLHATQPEVVPVLHQRAAHWYEEQGEFREAIIHALAASDFSLAMRLMEQAVERFWLGGEIQTIYHWLLTLPDTVVRAHARFVLTVVLYLINASSNTSSDQVMRVHKLAEQMMTRVERTALLAEKGTEDEQEQGASALPETERALLHRRLRLLRLYCEILGLNFRDGFKSYFLQAAQQIELVDQDEEILWQMIPLHAAFLLFYTIQRKANLLVPRLQEAKVRADQSGNLFAIIKVRQWLALTLWDAGRLRLTHRVCLEALALLEQIKGFALLAGYFSICLAHVFYQWNRLEEARPLIENTLHAALSWQHIDLSAWSHLSFAEIELAAGDLAAANQTFDQLEQFASLQTLTYYKSHATGLRVQWWLAQGNLVEASHLATQVALRPDDDPSAMDRYPEYLALARLFLAQHQPHKAIETLERFRVYLDLPGDIYITCSFLALYAVALHQAGLHRQARLAASRLFTLTEPEDFLRVYLDGGEPMKQLLQDLIDAPQEEGQDLSIVPRPYLLNLLAAFEQVERQHARPLGAPPIAREQDLPRTTQPSASTSAPVEPLSVRELEVLQLLSTGASNQDIADHLVISLTHG